MSPELLGALAGGVLIGLSAAFLLWANGRIAGVSGILGGALQPGIVDRSWRLAFLLGLVVSGALLAVLWPARFEFSGLPRLPWLALAGVLVGFGTRLGNGCTSGHGVCGIGRGSRRSIAATLTFMITAAITLYLVRHT
jgi:uncharacterized membrane protein YedE/YeeE